MCIQEQKSMQNLHLKVLVGIVAAERPNDTPRQMPTAQGRVTNTLFQGRSPQEHIPHPRGRRTALVHQQEAIQTVIPLHHDPIVEIPHQAETIVPLQGVTAHQAEAIPHLRDHREATVAVIPHLRDHQEVVVRVVQVEHQEVEKGADSPFHLIFYKLIF